MQPSSFFEEFIKGLPKDQQEALRQLRANILYIAPNSEEGVSSGVPAFKYKGKYLASMNAAKNHLSLFMMRGNALKDLQSELQGFDATNVAIKFSSEKPLPTELVEKVIAARIQEIEQSKPNE
jgi:uncharacterized protein YdhG (YjbR/CyaY superfamily)